MLYNVDYLSSFIAGVSIIIFSSFQGRVRESVRFQSGLFCGVGNSSHHYSISCSHHVNYSNLKLLYNEYQVVFKAFPTADLRSRQKTVPTLKLQDLRSTSTAFRRLLPRKKPAKRSTSHREFFRCDQRKTQRRTCENVNSRHATFIDCSTSLLNNYRVTSVIYR